MTVPIANELNWPKHTELAYTYTYYFNRVETIGMAFYIDIKISPPKNSRPYRENYSNNN